MNILCRFFCRHCHSVAGDDDGRFFFFRFSDGVSFTRRPEVSALLHLMWKDALLCLLSSRFFHSHFLTKVRQLSLELFRSVVGRVFSHAWRQVSLTFVHVFCASPNLSCEQIPCSLQQSSAQLPSRSYGRARGLGPLAHFVVSFPTCGLSLRTVELVGFFSSFQSAVR